MRAAVLAHLDLLDAARRQFLAVIAAWDDQTLQETLAADSSWTRQRVLVHVGVSYYYGYLGWIQERLGVPVLAPPLSEEQFAALSDMAEWRSVLGNDAKHYAEAALAAVADEDLDRVFQAYWGETFSIDQMLEHATCHFWRHARQILLDDLAKGRSLAGRDLLGLGKAKPTTRD